MKIIPQAPLNIVYVQVNKKFYDTIPTASGIVLYKYIAFHPENHSMCEATACSIPRAIQDRFDYQGMSVAEIAPGDRLLIRYDVIFHYQHQPDRDTPIYKNVLLYEGQEYWRVDVQQIFGILRKGSVQMLNGYIMCDPCEEKVQFGSFVTAEHFGLRVRNDLFRIRHIEERGLGLHPGDVVHIRPGIAQHYETDWGNFSIIKQSHILALQENLS